MFFIRLEHTIFWKTKYLYNNHKDPGELKKISTAEFNIIFFCIHETRSLLIHP